MCERCIEVDNQIARYPRLKSRATDRQIEEAAVRLLADLEAEKAALHPPEKLSRGSEHDQCI
jgi:ABC-type glutathione transport system ATPase component